MKKNKQCQNNIINIYYGFGGGLCFPHGLTPDHTNKYIVSVKSRITLLKLSIIIRTMFNYLKIKFLQNC